MKVLRILRNIGLIILAILLIGVGIVYWKKDSLIRSAIQSTAEQTGVDIQYKSASLSVFSTFPDVGISLDSLNIRPQDTTLAAISTIEQLTIGVQFWSLFSDEGYELNQIILDRPILHLNCGKNGKCNYDVFLQEAEEGNTSEQQPSAMKLSIENFTINNGQVTYTDSIALMQMKISQWNFKLAGRYAQNIFDAELKQESMSLSFISNGMKYADSLAVTANGKLRYDLDSSLLNISENEWSFNALRIMAEGMFEMHEDGYEMDLSFDLPGNEMKPLLSLIPAFYDENYEDLISEGSFAMNGNIKGRLDTDNEIYPALSLNAMIENGRIKYPDLPEDIHDINMEAHITKEEGNLDKTVVNVPNLHMKLASNSEMDASLDIRNPVSNAIVDGDIRLNADLANVQKVYPLESIKSLAGKLNVDASFNVNMEQLQSAQYDQVDIQGTASVNELRIKADNQPEVSINSLNASVNGKGINADLRQMKAGSSDIASVSVQTGAIGLFFQENKSFPIDLSITANSILVDEWMPEAEEGIGASEMSAPYDLSGYSIDFQSDIKELVYNIYQIKNINATGTFENGVIQISSGRFTYENANFDVSGTIDQLEEYLNETGPYYANLALRGGRFDLYDYMNGMESSTSNQASVSTEYFYLSPDMKVDVDYTLQGIDYGDIVLNNVRGALQLENGNIRIQSTNMEGMGGQLNIEGSLNTKEGTAPIFDFDAAVQTLQFSNTFNSIVTLDKVAPLLGRLKGMYDARISTAGSLDKELFPNISTLDAQGYIATKDVTLQSYEPISKFDKVLGTKLSSDFPLDNTQNWFAIQDGTVIIEPFTVALFEKDWVIEGQHQIGGQMNYQFSGPIPVEVIKSTEAGKKLLEEAQRIFSQIPLTSGISMEQVDVQVLLTGTRNNPQVKLNLASDFKELVKERVRERIQAEKKEVKDEVEKTIEEAGQTVKEAAKEKAKELITGKKDTTGQGQAVDSLKLKAEDKLEEAKEKLNKWNPFKNKKG